MERPGSRVGHPERPAHQGHSPPDRSEHSPDSLEREAERHADQGERGSPRDQGPPVEAAGVGLGGGRRGEDGAEDHQAHSDQAAGESEKLDQDEGGSDAADDEQGLELGLPHGDGGLPSLDPRCRE